MNHMNFAILMVLVHLAGCARQGNQPNAHISRFDVGQQLGKTLSLSEARYGFKTKLTREESSGEAVPDPPPSVFRTVRFDAPLGKMAAYISPDPQDGKRRPAIIWITGGDCNTIGNVWKEEPASNAQTASAFRKAGVIMMFPTLRGGNDNPGFREGFFGEVDDVVAAAEYLARQAFVDPNRIYLGGHSTGGTLVLLVAASSDRFRAVFSFGPVADVAGYDSELLPFDTSDERELALRSPGHWLHSIRVPVFVFEGTQDNSNSYDLQAMAQASTNAKVRFHTVKGADHFSVLGPTNKLIADEILRDEGPTTNLAFDEEQLSRPFQK